MKANDVSEHHMIIRPPGIFLCIDPQNETLSAIKSVLTFQASGRAQTAAEK